MNAVSRNETRQKFKIVQNWHIGELHRNDNFFEIIQTFVSSVSLLENSLSLYTISLSLTVFLNLSILNSLFFLFYFSPSIFYSLHFTLSLFNSLSLSLSLSVTVLLNLSFFLSLSFLLSLSFPISIFLYLTLFFPFVYPSLCLLWTNPVIFFIDFRLFKHTLQILQHIGV